MSKLTKEKRKKIEELVLRTMGILDATNANRDRYERFFKGMNDAAFVKWLEELKADPNKHFYLEVVPFENEPSFDQIKSAAKYLGVKLHQHVYYRHDLPPGAEPVATMVPVPVGYMHIRRLQQILSKKTSYSTDANKRNQLTGQLSGDDAVGRLADEESYGLKTVNADVVLKELLGPRADNRDKRLQMYQAIEKDGFVRYEDLIGDSKNQPMLNYMDVILTAAGLKSDLVDSTNVLRTTVDRKVKNA